MYLIDTNVFLELFLDQDKKEIAGEIFNKIERKEIKAVLSGFALHSIEYILSISEVLNRFPGSFLPQG
jgi:predicted nucleic acid-binding protein